MADDARSLKVIVVDDAIDNANLLGFILTKMGLDTAVKTSAQEVLAAARQNVPDLILSDIGMPGMDGYELAKAVRADDQLSGVMLGALTGYGEKSDRDEALAAGFDFHLLKPVKKDELEAVIRKVKKTLGLEVN